MVEVLTSLAVEALGVVGALAPPMHHVGAVRHPGQGETAGGVSVAGARASHHHLVDAVVVLFLVVWGC